jgi:cyclophilin family peptidyl-prolyl cis-trans isomerase
MMGIPSASGEVFLNTRVQPEAYLDRDETLQLELGEFFQVFQDPGPVATFTFRLPEQTGIQTLKIDFQQDNFQNPIYDDSGRFIPIHEGSRTANIMTYKLLSGGTYDHFYAVAPEDFVWHQHSIRYQLLADVAPVTVANFLHYAKSGAYSNTVIHRSEINVLQGGGWTHFLQGGFVLDTIETMDPIPLERTWSNPEGTLSMARQSADDTATSQFFINVADNATAFGDNYAVFGDLLNKQQAQALLEEMQAVTVWNYGGAFSALPLFSGYLDDIDSWIHFDSVTISRGEVGEVAHQWSFIDPNGDGSLSARELAFQGAFDIVMEGGNLRISRNDSGEARIRVTGSYKGQSHQFEVDLVGYNKEALRALPASVIHPGGWIDNPWYGWVTAEEFPFIQHLNHGYQYMIVTFSDFPDNHDYFIYDFKMGGWLHTSASIYPYMFMYSLNSWVWYVEGSGNGANAKRWFFNFNSGQWFQD